MVERRDLMSGGLVAGLTALVAPAATADAAVEQDDGVRVASAINDLRSTVQGQFDMTLAPGRAMRAVRRQQREFIRSTQKYPDFIEVGLDIWDGLYDWHVQNQLPLVVERRAADGRYIMAFMFTSIVLRPEQTLDYVGYPFEAEPRRP